MPTLTIADIAIEVIRKDIKNIHLAVYPPNGRVRLAAPLETDEEAIRMFVISRLPWIRRNQRKFGRQERHPPRQYKNRESHYLWGRRYLLNVVEHDGSAKVVPRSKTYIDLFVRPGTGTEKRHGIMTEWYRGQIKKLVPGYIKKWEERMGVTVREWQVRTMKTKWGSCNPDTGRILINLELVKKPEHLLEYIIVHEMVHLLERRHNERFRQILSEHMPNWKKLRSELNSLPVGHSEWEV